MVGQQARPTACGCSFFPGHRAIRRQIPQQIRDLLCHIVVGTLPREVQVPHARRRLGFRVSRARTPMARWTPEDAWIWVKTHGQKSIVYLPRTQLTSVLIGKDHALAPKQGSIRFYLCLPLLAPDSQDSETVPMTLVNCNDLVDASVSDMRTSTSYILSWECLQCHSINGHWPSPSAVKSVMSHNATTS